MAFPIPKIVYATITLNFTFPPIQKPGESDREAMRTDTISLSGLKQSVHWRMDKFINLQMDWVPIADIAAWGAFIDYAIAGGEFDYYPDATVANFITYRLEDAKWLPKFNFRTMDKFTLRLREVAV